MTRPLLRAFVDETGDRGTSPTSSRFFAFAGVVVAEEAWPSLKDRTLECRSKFEVPATKPMHWQEHIKRFPRRAYAARQFGSVRDLQVNYVVMEKASLPAESVMRTWRDPEK